MITSLLVKSTIIRNVGLTKIISHTISVSAIWISVWFFEVGLNIFKILPVNPTLLFPEQITIFFVLSIFFKGIFIFLYFRIMFYKHTLRYKLPVKIVLRNKYCLVKNLNLLIFAFECQMPIIDQITHLETLNDWDPFFVLFNWNTGKLQFIFYRKSSLNNFNNQHDQMLMFFERSFNKVTIIPPYKLKNIILSSNPKRSEEFIRNYRKEFIGSKEQFSDISKSIEKTKYYVKENAFNESMDQVVDLNSVFYWQFPVDFLKGIDKDILKNFNNKKVILAQINYEFIHSNETEVVSNQKEPIQLPYLALPPIKKRIIDIENSTIQLLLYILNKWMFKKISINENKNASEQGNKTKNEGKLIPKEEKKSFLKENQNISRDQNNTSKKSTINNKKHIKINFNNKNAMVTKNNNLENYFLEGKGRNLSESEKIQQNNFIAALDLISEENSKKSNFKKNDVSETNDFKNNFHFTDFCKNFCSKFSQVQQSDTNLPEYCLNSLNSNKSYLNQICSVMKPTNDNNIVIRMVKSIIRDQKLDRDKTACLLTLTSISTQNSDLEEDNLKYQLFRELFI
jgi:hypothetical protein